MYCRNCGKQLNERACFCGNCGTRVRYIEPQKPISTGKKVAKAGKKILFWILSIFLLLSGLAFMPSFASLFFFVATALILPVDKIQEKLKKIFRKKFLKGGLCWGLVFAAMFMAPTDSTPTNEPTTAAVSPVIEQEIENIQDTQAEIAETEKPVNGVQTETEKPTEETSVTTQTPIEEAQVVPTAITEEEQIPVNSTFEIHYIDVGQADASLILCDGKAMLIDGGDSGDSSLIYSYLKNHNISHLDYVVATHGHGDHVGGLSGALNYATVGKAYCSVSSYDSEEFRDFVRFLDEQDKEITIPNVGENFKLGSASVQIVAVNGSAVDPNNASIMLRIVYGDTSFLFTGDAERETEQAALNSGYDLESTVLKVGHHGSENSTEYVFLRQVAPQYAVISVGEDNAYGHPTEDALSRLRDADVKTFRTDLQGTIICVSDGTEVGFTVSKNEDADTLAPVATLEQLQDIIKRAVDKYNGSSNKKLDGKLAYTVINKTEVQLTYNASKNLTADEEYLVDEAMQQIMDVVLADVAASNYSLSEQVSAEISVNYAIYEGEQVPTNIEPEVVGTDYIGNKNTKKFHYAGCSSVKQMKESNKYYYTGTRDEMIAKGYVPCQRCNP